MAPIDPNELLKAFKQLLNQNGGISNCEVVPRMSGLMRKYSKKLVSRCIYYNILVATSQDVLEEFLEQDGWNIINGWLKDATKDRNDAFLKELLRLLDHCPVTVERLKQNDTAKVVKTLSKSKEQKEMSDKAGELVAKWMQIITENNEKVAAEKAAKEAKDEQQRSADDNKKKRKKESIVGRENSDSFNKAKKHKKDSINNGTDDLFVVNDRLVPSVKTSAPTVENCIQKREALSDELSQDGSNSNSNDGIRFEVKRSTAKIRLGKARSIYDSLPSVTPKVDGKPSTPNNKVAGKPSLVTNMSGFGGQQLSKQVPSLGVRSGGIKLIDAKPLPNSINNQTPVVNTVNKASHTIKESASFVDAIITTSETIKSMFPKKPKVRRLSSIEKGLSPSDNAESGGDEDDPMASSGGEPPEMSEIERQIEDALSREDAAGSMYAEGVDDDFDYNVNGPDNEQETVTFYGSSSVAHDSSSQDSQAHQSKQVKSILCYGRRLSGKKKSVKWQSEEKIKQIRLFEVDESERTNVARALMDARAEEAKKEKEAILSTRRGAPMSLMPPIELMQWRVALIDLPDGLPLADCGKNSREKGIQAERQMSILPEFYPTRDMAPDYPQEPEFEGFAGAHEAPRLIPLDDQNNLSVYDFSHVPLPPPKTDSDMQQQQQFQAPIMQQQPPPNLNRPPPQNPPNLNRPPPQHPLNQMRPPLQHPQNPMRPPQQFQGGPPIHSNGPPVWHGNRKKFNHNNRRGHVPWHKR